MSVESPETDISEDRLPAAREEAYVYSISGQRPDAKFQELRWCYEHDSQRVPDILAKFATLIARYDVVPFWGSFREFRIAEIVVDYLGQEHAGRNQDIALAIVYGAARQRDHQYFDELMKVNVLPAILEIRSCRNLDDMDLVYQTLSVIMVKSIGLRDAIMTQTNVESVWIQFMSAQGSVDRDSIYSTFLANACCFEIPEEIVVTYVDQVKRFLDAFGFKRYHLQRVLREMSSRIFFVHKNYQLMLRESGLLKLLLRLVSSELRNEREYGQAEQKITLSALLLFAYALEEPVDFELPWDEMKSWVCHPNVAIAQASLIAIGNGFESMPFVISHVLDEQFAQVLLTLSQEGANDTRMEAMNVLAEAACFGEHSIRIQLAKHNVMEWLCDLATTCGDLLNIQLMAIEKLFQAVEKEAGTAEALRLFDSGQCDILDLECPQCEAHESLLNTIHQARAAVENGHA